MKQRMKYLISLVLLHLFIGGAAWAQDFDPSNPPDPYMLYKVIATDTDNNYTSGSDSYTAGTQVTINTSARSTDYVFKHWLKDGVLYTTNRQFTYTVEAANVRFLAVYEFSPENPSDPQGIYEYRLYLVPDPEGACSFNRTSGEKAQAGNTVSVTAYANQGFVFDGWYNGETKVAATATYSSFVMPSANTTLTAKFIYNPTMPGDPESTQENIDTGGILGDIDGDGELSVTDVVMMVSAVMNPSSIDNITKYDMDGDGEASVTDVVMLVSLVMNN